MLSRYRDALEDFLSRATSDDDEKMTGEAPPPQEQAKTPQDRKELLKSIRERIGNGFYNTESVLEDLSHSFAKALDSAI